MLLCADNVGFCRYSAMTAGKTKSSKLPYSHGLRAGMRGRILLALLPLSLGLYAAIAQSDSLAEARRLFLRGGNDQAAQILEREIKTHPEAWEAHLLLGQIYALEERRAESIHELGRAIELRPDSATAYN